MRADLDATIRPCSFQRTQTVAEAHGLTHMPPPVRRLYDFICNGHASRHVGDQANARRREPNGPRRLFELIEDRLHQRRVESMRHGQRMDLHALLLKAMTD